MSHIKANTSISIHNKTENELFRIDWCSETGVLPRVDEFAYSSRCTPVCGLTSFCQHVLPGFVIWGLVALLRNPSELGIFRGIEREREEI